MAHIPALWATFALAASAACGGSQPRGKGFIDLPERVSVATLAGPMCEGKACSCASQPAMAGLPERPGWKRYQIRVGPIENELWVLVNSMVLYKTVERATECFYVDLPTGKHTMTVRGQGEHAFAARVHVSELGALGGYNTFEFACGGPGSCDMDRLQRWYRSLAKYRRNIHDPCGSTRVRDIRWQAGETPDRIHPSQVQVDLVLDVYDFTPQHASGDPACADRY